MEQSTFSEPDWQDLEIELRAAGFQIESCLSRTLSSLVFKARQELLGRQVAIKILKQAQSDEAYERFQRETKLLASFSCEHIVRLYASGKLADRRPYMVMEFLAGASLAQVLDREGPFAQEKIIAYALQICHALGYAHERGIVHRDLKPENLIIENSDEGEKVKLIDFGIFKALDTAADKQLTQAGALPGTAAYMSPEQCRNEAVDGRSDFYSLACLLYELAVGKTPFQEENDWLMLSAQISKKVEKVPAAKPISRQLEELILKCLSKDPAQRFQSAQELEIALLQASKNKGGSGSIPFPRDSKRIFLFGLFTVCACSVFLAGISVLKQQLGLSRQEGERIKYNYNWQEFKRSISGLPANEKELSCRKWIKRKVHDSAISVFELGEALDMSGPPRFWNAGEYTLLDDIRRRAESDLAKSRQKQNRDFNSESRVLALLLRSQLEIGRGPKEFDSSLEQLFDLQESGSDVSNNQVLGLSAVLEREAHMGLSLQVENTYKKYAGKVKSDSGRLTVQIAAWQAFNRLGNNKMANICLQEILKQCSNVSELEKVRGLGSLFFTLAEFGRYDEIVQLGEALNISSPKTDDDYLFCFCYGQALIERSKFRELDALLARLSACKIEESKESRQFDLLSLKLSAALKQDRRAQVKALMEDLICLTQKSGKENLNAERAFAAACVKYGDAAPLLASKLEKDNPVLVGRVYVTAAHYLRDGGKDIEALRLYEPGIKLLQSANTYQQGLASGLVGMASSYRNQKRFKETQETLRKAIQVASANHDEAWQHEAEAAEADTLRETGNVKSAIEAHKKQFNKAFNKRGQYPALFARLLLTLATEYELNGEKQKAIELIDKYYQELNWSDASVRYHGASIDKLRKSLAD